jgi:hypothetical protein
VSLFFEIVLFLIFAISIYAILVPNNPSIVVRGNRYQIVKPQAGLFGVFFFAVLLISFIRAILAALTIHMSSSAITSIALQINASRNIAYLDYLLIISAFLIAIIQTRIERVNDKTAKRTAPPDNHLNAQKPQTVLTILARFTIVMLLALAVSASVILLVQIALYAEILIYLLIAGLILLTLLLIFLSKFIPLNDPTRQSLTRYLRLAILLVFSLLISTQLANMFLTQAEAHLFHNQFYDLFDWLRVIMIFSILFLPASYIGFAIVVSGEALIHQKQEVLAWLFNGNLIGSVILILILVPAMFYGIITIGIGYIDFETLFSILALILGIVSILFVFIAVIRILIVGAEEILIFDIVLASVVVFYLVCAIFFFIYGPVCIAYYNGT